MPVPPSLQSTGVPCTNRLHQIQSILTRSSLRSTVRMRAASKQRVAHRHTMHGYGQKMADQAGVLPALSTEISGRMTMQSNGADTLVRAVR